jgi:ATP-dependent Clp protease ATP-binding subunit ClpC
MDIKFPVNKMPWSEELKAAWRYVVESTCAKSIYFVDLLTTEIGLLTMPDDTARRIWTAAGLMPGVDEAVAHLSKIFDKYADNYRKKFPGPEIIYSNKFNNVVRHAEQQATLMGRPAVEVGTFLYGVECFKDFELCQWPVEDYPHYKVYNYLLVLYGLEKKLASRSIPVTKPAVAVQVPPSAVGAPGLVRSAPTVRIPENLAAFVSDMTASALRYDPVFGREKEIQEVIEVLARRMKNSAILVGPPGVGKTAIAEELARRMLEGKVPRQLRDKRLLKLDVGAMLSGTTLRGQFEARVLDVVRYIEDVGRAAILFVDEIHMLVKAGDAAHGASAGNLLKPALAREGMTLLGATTDDEYRNFIECDPAFARRFTVVRIDEPSVEQAIEMLKRSKSLYERHHRVAIPDEAIEAMVTLSKRYIANRYLPDKAFDVLDRAAVARSMAHAGEGDAVVTTRDVAEVVAAQAKLPIERVLATMTDRLKGLEAFLKGRVIGQDAAVEAVCQAIVGGYANLSARRGPIAKLLFVGPSGVGKTELARSIAACLFDDEDAMVTLDMGEFYDKHTVSSLIGSPPGYIGSERGGRLTEPVRQRPYCVVLLDEIDKSHPEVWNIMLPLLDEGRLLDAMGRPASFENTIVIMTANVPHDRQPRLGFIHGEDAQQYDQQVVQRMFPPYLLGRVDKVVTFTPLTPEAMRRILDIEVEKVVNGMRERGKEVVVDESARCWLLARGCGGTTNVRGLKQAVAEHLAHPLMMQALDGGEGKGTIVVSAQPSGERLQFAPAHQQVAM